MHYRLSVVTATTNRERARDCIESWSWRASGQILFHVVYDVMGTVPAFARGLRAALEGDADIIACLHDDLHIEQPGWDHMVLEHFDSHPACGLLGFGGALGLGDADIYQKPYEPHQLARKDFISNMRDAEAHGRRVTEPTRVSCLDGFSLVGRREFWEGWQLKQALSHDYVERKKDQGNLFEQFQALGLIHHCYDSLLGCFAKRLGWEVWMLPVKVHHFGGRTAVSDQDYHAWAKTQDPNGDSGFWEAAHRIGYQEFRDCLPLSV